MPYDASNPMARRAAELLRANDTGAAIKAAPTLYPHQWSWDSALIAIGIAHVSIDRALDEFRSLFRGQWKNGMIPQIQFSPDVDPEAYFPDAARWDTESSSSDAPDGIATSGIIQPPVHAIAMRAIVERVSPEQAREIAHEFYRPLLAWHRYLMSVRDPENSGLITIVHPWESGMDNSPRWDEALARIVVPEGELPPYQRRDLSHVAAPSQRPTDHDYDRFMWILEVLKRGGYRVDQIYAELPFRMKDVFSSALLVTSNEALMYLATLADVELEEMDIIEAWINRGRRGLAERWDQARGLCNDFDLIAEADVTIRTIASFSPLLAGQLSPQMRTAMTSLWRSEAFTGAPDLRWPLPPSTSPGEPAFNPQRYWRGPVWPVMNWLFWRAWIRIGEFGIADQLRWSSLDQIETSGFYEYLDPFTGEGLGSESQSWTAAAVLDWLADQSWGTEVA